MNATSTRVTLVHEGERLDMAARTGVSIGELVPPPKAHQPSGFLITTADGTVVDGEAAVGTDVLEGTVLVTTPARADLRRYETTDSDLERVLRSSVGETAVVLSGHSTGGLVASLWADRHPGALRALVLNSAWLSLQGSEIVRTVGDPVLRTLALRDPRMSILDGWVDPARAFSITDGWDTERDGELPDPAWADDPYVTGWDINPAWSIKPSAPVRVGWLQAVMEGHNRVAQGLDIRCPVLSMGAASTRLGVTWTPESRSADTIIDADATARRAVMLGKLVTIARFPGGVHDLTLSEPPVREQVFSTLRRWMSAYVLR